MKKLFLIVALVLSSCGGIEGNDFDLFNEYYSDCVEYCTADAKWSGACGYALLDLEACTRHVWDAGCANMWCAARVITINETDYEFQIASGNRDEYCVLYDARTDKALPEVSSVCN